jgi:histidine triad (HIT) family protein
MSDCLFCRIASGDIPSTEVHADDDVFAFRDIDPKAPTHILLIPRRHIGSTDDLAAADAELVGKIVLVAAELARREGLDAGGYRLVTNCGADGGQTVGHLHFHLLGGRQLSWPPG